MEYKGILLIGILAFLLYHLLGSCNCNDGFSVGFDACPKLDAWDKLIDEIKDCYSFEKCEFDKDFFGNTCKSFVGDATCGDVSRNSVWTDGSLSNNQKGDICTKYGNTNKINCKSVGGKGPNETNCVKVSK